MEHDKGCIIGLWWDDLGHCTNLITENEVVEYVRNNNERSDRLEAERSSARLMKTSVRNELDGLYEDFNFCPACGKKIDWKGLKERNINR